MDCACNRTVPSEEQRRILTDAYHAGAYRHGTPEQDLIWKLVNTARYTGQGLACAQGRRRI